MKEYRDESIADEQAKKKVPAEFRLFSWFI